MPQMMPINWLMSFFFFFLTFMLFNMMNYYIFSMKSKISPQNFILKKNFHWKW